MSEEQTGPFGLYMGMLLDELDAEPVIDTLGKYFLASVPKPHSAFGSYAVQVGNRTGLSWIKAIGRDIETSTYGYELSTVFEDMKVKLDKAYGQSEHTDILLHESIWDEPKDWMSALMNKERILMSVWDLSNGANLKNDLISIALVTQASDTNAGYISIEYQFLNSDECDAEIAAIEDCVL